MGTVYLRSTAAPDGTYQNLNAILTHAQLDNNMTLFLRNDVDDTLSGNLTVTGSITGTLNGAATTLRVVDGGTAQNPSVTYAARGGMSNPNQYAQGLFWEFKNAGQVGGLGNYAGLLTFAPWVGTTGSTGDPNYQFAIYPAGINSVSPPTMRIRSGIDGTWGNWSVIATNARAFAQNLILG